MQSELFMLGVAAYIVKCDYIYIYIYIYIKPKMNNFYYIYIYVLEIINFWFSCHG